MKKIVSLALCAALACALLAGCGGGSSKKIPPENFPHSETLRMDATIDEVVKAEGLQPMPLQDNSYDFTTATIDGTQFDVIFFPLLELDKMSTSYFITEPSTNLEKLYKHFVTYFSNIYGETSEEASIDSDLVQLLKSKLWRYTFDGNEYVIEIHLQSIGEETQLMIVTAPAERFTL